MTSIRTTLGLAATLTLAVAAAGCGDSLGLGYGGMEGRYDYEGTVDGAPFYEIDGEIRVRNQRGSDADVDIDWVMRDERGTAVYVIRSDSPARAYISGDYISFRFEGWLDGGSSGDIYFVLDHEGEVSGRTMAGYWDLDTDYYGQDSGTFRARR